MTSFSPAPVGTPARIAGYKARAADIRERGRRLFDGGATGIQVGAALSESTEEFVVELLEEQLQGLSNAQRAQIGSQAAVAVVGGSGRAEMAPYSDVDLLILNDGAANGLFSEIAPEVLRNCWDAGMNLGHSIRTVSDALSMARHDVPFATSLIDTRTIWGNAALVDGLMRRFRRSVISRRLRTFIESCAAARDEERNQFGGTVCQLEPDIKRSMGGLRDVHLIRWIGFARYGVSSIDSLRLEGGLDKVDARNLLAAQEFLMRVRTNLHFYAGKPQDLLTREEQLRIADESGIAAQVGQSPVELFMQTYFSHSTNVAEIANRFVASHRRRRLSSRLADIATTHRADRIFRVGSSTIDVLPAYRKSACSSLVKILKIYELAGGYGVQPTPQLVQLIKNNAAQIEDEPAGEAGKLFLSILRRSMNLGRTLRSMYETGVLERVLPEMRHARCLLQFNQYHSYTVDEHTLRAVEVAQRLEADDGPIGTAYKAINHKEILHLALLLHDLGKGYDEDHSEVGRRLAERVAGRLQLSDHKRDMLILLVHQHLLMAKLAFLRNVADPDLQFQFSRLVGSPETLRMLYVLTAADVTAVGPGVWTDWKAELLSDLFDHAMLNLSGKGHRFHEDSRLKEVKNRVRQSIVPLESAPDERELRKWVDKQLDTLPAHYVLATAPAKIAADLERIQQLAPGEIYVEGHYDPDNGTVEYNVITGAQFASGCFHRIAGVLAAKRLEILTAQINTSLDGVVIDVFRVVDRDFADEPPPPRIAEVREAIRVVLTGAATVKNVFQKYKRFDSGRPVENMADLPTRVVIDNDSSEQCTVIDVFAFDRPGLLYTICRTLYRLELSVVLAKIGTHLDQVVDVFYVTDDQGRKIVDGPRLTEIRQELEQRVSEFESDGHLQFT